ncbi:MAG: hypothetical protein LQ340_001693 [Diploschistes diacapsis]|nr:MAG: hypothetical protein LQ340_001693 [Diploschistes diacapsis]
MLSHRLVTSTLSRCRPYSTTAAVLRTASLADIRHEDSAEFDRRQREFREASRLAQKAKAEQDSQFVKSSKQAHPPSDFPDAGSGPPTAPTASDASSGTGNGNVASSIVSDIKNKLSLSSLSTADAGAAREQTSKDESSKRKGALASLIYGTKEGQQLDQEIERSFSQVLARGKYVHSIVFHTVKPDKVDEYVKLVGDWYPKVAGTEENHVHLVGSWRTEVGDCDTFVPTTSILILLSLFICSMLRSLTTTVHIWEYQRYEGYHASLHNISHHPEFPEFDRQLRSLITSKNTSLMQEFSFWPTTPPRKLGGLFELRSYTLHPGNLLEWETHWRKGLKARREVMEGVGAWFVQVGDLNMVHHLWQFADLEERKARRELSWGVEGWGETVHKTVPLIQTMRSRILIPLPWSPVS